MSPGPALVSRAKVGYQSFSATEKCFVCDNASGFDPTMLLHPQQAPELSSMHHLVASA